MSAIALFRLCRATFLGLLITLVAIPRAHAQEAVATEKPRAEESPPWRPSDELPDLGMAIARQAPLEWQATALLLVDTFVPVAVAIVPAILGAVVAASLTAIPASVVKPGEFSIVFGAAALPAAVFGALIAGGAAMLATDVALSTFHLPRLAPARLVGLLMMAPPAAATLVYAVWVTTPHPQIHPALEAALVTGVVVTLWLNFTLIPVMALLTSAFVRAFVDYQEGSPLWAKEEAPKAQ